MLKRFDAIVTQFDGTPWKDEKGQELKVSTVIVSALMAQFEDEKSLSGEEKLKRYLIAQRVYEAGSTATEVSAENISLIKACVAKAYATGVVGWVFSYLEGDADTAPRRLVPVREKAKA